MELTVIAPTFQAVTGAIAPRDSCFTEHNAPVSLYIYTPRTLGLSAIVTFLLFVNNNCYVIHYYDVHVTLLL